jgi:putative nucleotidyltransferase with HDIG domain
MWSKWQLAFRQFLEDPRFRESRGVRICIYVGLTLLIYIVLLGSVLPPRYHFAVGQVSPVTIRAPITAVDTQATAAAQQAAMAKVPKQYQMSTQVETDAVNALQHLFSAVRQANGDKNLTPAKRLADVTAAAPKGVDAQTLRSLLAMSPEQLGLVENVSLRIVENLLGKPFYQESADQAVLLVDQQMLGYDLDRASQRAVEDLVVSVLKPNMVYQAAATEAAREAAKKSVPPVLIHQGDVIVSKNGIITESVQSRLKDVGLYSTRPDYGVMGGFLLYVVLAVGLLALYIERRAPRRRLDNLMLAILGLIMLLTDVFICAAKGVVNAGGPSSIAYLVPMAVGSMLTTVLIDSSLAVVASMYESLLFGAAMGQDYWIMFISFVGSLVGAYSLAKVTQRGAFMRAGFAVSAVNVVAVVAMLLMRHDPNLTWQTAGIRIGLSALNGVLSAVLTMGILPFFESAFGLITTIRLLELANPNHPLLKRLLMEAPGTYHHSLIVGNLAEAAAEIVGADPLLCRVGAYYHDVGKMRRPLFFVENQMTKENPHEKLSPSLSHLIITSHVSDGLEMLEQYGIPKPIRDICASHHGTTVLWYFYNKAKEQDKNGTVRPDDFRYPGPKPKTRECAIVMICDAVEAAVRSMQRPTPGRVEGVIRKIIRDRLEDGQLDECDLTLQDLDVMVSAFMKTLKGIYHHRIEYPDLDKLRKEIAK